MDLNDSKNQPTMNTPLQQQKEVVKTPTSSMSATMPLQLSGFLTGDTIQVQGDTGDLKFSVRLDITKKLFPEKPEEFSTQDSAFSSPYATPIASQEEVLIDQNELNSWDAARVVASLGATTRLRTGAITPVLYFPPRVSLGKLRRKSRWNKNKNNNKIKDVVERALRRRSFPMRPCTSYAFFVMATWGTVKASSFGKTSKRIGQLWYQLPSNEKKLYEEMAMKDSARYKWQSELFVNNEPRPFREVEEDDGL